MAMIEIPRLITDPLTEHARAVLEVILKRRQRGEIEPPSVTRLAEETEMPAPVVRAAVDELHERRLVVVDEEGTLAPARWPRLVSLTGRLRLNLAEELVAAGIPIDETTAREWEAADDEARPPEAEPPEGSPAHHTFQAIVAAHGGRMAEALEQCRHVAAAVASVRVVPMLARLSGWLDRVMLAAGMPEARFFRLMRRQRAEELSETLFRQGWQAEVVRNYDRAERAYVEALRQAPGFDAARIRYAAVLAKSGRLAQAEREMARLVRARPSLAAAHLMRAELLLRLAHQGEGPTRLSHEVRQHAEAAIEAGGDMAWADLLVARALIAEGEPQQAVAHAKRATALAPELGEAYHWLGQALTAMGELLEAAWAEAAALLADHQMAVAAEALFNLRQAPSVAAQVPHARLFIDAAWQ